MEAKEILFRVNRVNKRASEILFQNYRDRVPCFNCTEAYCCKSRKEINVYSFEKDKILSLVTPEIKERAKRENPNSYTCPFLIDNRCSIYEDRPLECRNYYVIDQEDKDCKESNKASNIINLIELYFSLDQTLIFTLPSKIKDEKAIDLLELIKEC